MPRDTLAYDRSARRIDEDGRLHIALTPISKANINPYFGREIPNGQSLGLIPDRIYKMFRDPKELATSAATSNNIQLLELHRGVSATDPGKDATVGSTGTDAVFRPPYLLNSLVVWDQEAIDLIESEQKKELSCSYRYDAEMVPGSYLGENYDGVMRNIRFNHVALVKEGRAGADVMVADAMPLELQHEDHKMPNVTPAIARGALAMYLKPLLASDAKIDMKAVLLGGATTFAYDRLEITKRLKTETNGKLAKGVKLEAAPLQFAFDTMEEEAEDEWPDKDDDDDDKDKKSDDESEEEIRAKEAKEAEELIAAKKAAKDKRAKDKKAKDKAAKDAADKAAMDADKDDDDKADDEDDDDKDEKKKAEDMKAMDAAIAKAKQETKAEMIAERKALREAEEIIKPLLGTLTCDSAPEAFKALFKAEKVDITGVPEVAFPALARQTVKAALAVKGQRQPTLVHDSASVKDFAKRFPAAAAVRQI